MMRQGSATIFSAAIETEPGLVLVDSIPPTYPSSVSWQKMSVKVEEENFHVETSPETEVQNVENSGIEPETSCMLSTRSAN